MTALFSVCLFFHVSLWMFVLCCKRRNEKGVAHNEQKTHTELWDVNSLPVYSLFLYIRPEELMT